ncbi:unnamed protein product, partial [Brachionus calyciflorus]
MFIKYLNLFIILKTILLCPVIITSTCPYPICKTKYLNSSFCSVYCSENTIPDPCLTKINQIDGFTLTNLSHLRQDAFFNVNVNFLRIQNSDLKYVSQETFRGIKYVKELNLINVTNSQLLLNEETAKNLQGKIDILRLSRINSAISLDYLLKLTDNISLTELCLENLKLPNINLDLTFNSKLKKISLRSDLIENINIKLNRFIQNIDLTNNNIKNIYLNINSMDNQLNELILINNKLNSLELPYLPMLKELHLDNNIFNNPSDLNLKKSLNLTSIQITNNHFQYFQIDYFEPYQQLKYLNLYDNDLNELTKFHNMTIVNINLSKNNYSRVYFDNFLNLSKLEILDLSFNYIEYIELNLSSLKTLYLISNKIKLFDLKYLINLEHISLCNNRIENYLNLTSLKNIKYLDMSSNIFKILNTSELILIERMSTLFLSSNKIEKLPVFPYLRLIKDVFLRNNLIKSIEKDTFSNLIYLDHLDLGNNYIHFIDMEAFQSNKMLNILNLADNYLTQIPNISNLNNLEEFYLTNQTG